MTGSGTVRAAFGHGSGTVRAQTRGSSPGNTCKEAETARGVLPDTSRQGARSRTGTTDRPAFGVPLASLAVPPGERVPKDPGRPLTGPAPRRCAAPDGSRRPGGLTAANHSYGTNRRGGCAARDYPAGTPAGTLTHLIRPANWSSA